MDPVEKTEMDAAWRVFGNIPFRDEPEVEPGVCFERPEVGDVVRALEGEPATTYCGTTSPFLDVPYTAPMCRYIKRLYELGVTTGCGNGNYCPTQTVNRQQMAAFLARAFLGMQ